MADQGVSGEASTDSTSSSSDITFGEIQPYPQARLVKMSTIDLDSTSSSGCSEGKTASHRDVNLVIAPESQEERRSATLSKNKERPDFRIVLDALRSWGHGMYESEFSKPEVLFGMLVFVFACLMLTLFLVVTAFDIFYIIPYRPYPGEPEPFPPPQIYLHPGKLSLLVIGTVLTLIPLFTLLPLFTLNWPYPGLPNWAPRGSPKAIKTGYWCSLLSTITQAGLGIFLLVTYTILRHDLGDASFISCLLVTLLSTAATAAIFWGFRNQEPTAEDDDPASPASPSYPTHVLIALSLAQLISELLLVLQYTWSSWSPISSVHHLTVIITAPTLQVLNLVLLLTSLACPIAAHFGLIAWYDPKWVRSLGIGASGASLLVQLGLAVLFGFSLPTGKLRACFALTLIQMLLTALSCRWWWLAPNVSDDAEAPTAQQEDNNAPDDKQVKLDSKSKSSSRSN